MNATKKGRPMKRSLCKYIAIILYSIIAIIAMAKHGFNIIELFYYTIFGITLNFGIDDIKETMKEIF
jgi:hypothetical protein